MPIQPAGIIEHFLGSLAAKRQLARINSGVQVRGHVADLVPANIEELLAQSDILLDCTDNFETRYLLNDYAVSAGKPWIYAAAIGAFAATMNILPDGDSRTACLACIFPAMPSGNVETCDTAGILSTAVNFAASLQVTETLRRCRPSATRPKAYNSLSRSSFLSTLPN